MLDQIHNTNKNFIIGVDECGTGSWAGEIFVCAVRSPKNWTYHGLTDSKKLSRKKREQISSELILSNQITYSVVSFHAYEIDNFFKVGKNLGDALRDLYTQAIRNLDQTDSLIVLDGLQKIEGIDHVSLPKADSLVPAVSAASVLAKVTRDAKMKELSCIYPEYGFESNMGYGSAKHREALEKYGPCLIHRFSYKPIRDLIRK